MGWLAAIAPAAIGGALGLGGSAMSNAFNRKEGRRQRKFNAREAQKNRDFQEEMSSTAVRRRATDLRKAGFNRILSVANPGAAQPGGATAASYQRAQSADIAGNVAKGASTAVAARLAHQQVKDMKATNWQTQVNTGKLGMEESLFKQRSIGQSIQNRILQEQLKGWEREGAIDESTAGEVMRWMNRISSSAQGVMGAIPDLRKVRKIPIRGRRR